MPDAAPPDDDDLAAAELVLRLSDDDEAAALQARAARDPVFSARVDRWQERFAPLYAEIVPVPAPHTMWDRIAAQLIDPVDALRRRLRRWQWATGAAAAMAAALAVMVVRPVARPPIAASLPTSAPAPLLAVAQLSDDRGTPLLAVGIERRSGRVSIRRQDLHEDGRVPELWLIPAGGAPRSLGLIPANGRLDTLLPDDLRSGIDKGVTLAVSMEQAEGAPHAAPAGPIVATGALVTL
jgi:anti-sigma-K factor RskA